MKIKKCLLFLMILSLNFFGIGCDRTSETPDKKRINEIGVGEFDNYINVHGRTFFSNGIINMGYSSTGFSVTFYGTELYLKMKSNGNSTIMNVYIDNVDKLYYFNDEINDYSNAIEEYNNVCPHLLLNENIEKYMVAYDLKEGMHTVTLLKRGEVTYTSMASLYGIKTDGYIMEKQKKNTRNIEVIGDSNITGYGNLSLDSSSGYSFETQDSTISFSSYLAAEFGAEYSIVAKSGVTFTKNENECSEGYMLDTYLKTDYWNDEKKDFFKFEDENYDINIIHLGDNDHDGRAGELSEREAIDNYKKFIKQVRQYNRKSKILVVFSLCGYYDWRELVETVVDEINEEGDADVFYYGIKNTDNRAPAGHPSMSVHKNAAKEVADKIRKILNWNEKIYPIYISDDVKIALKNNQMLRYEANEKVKLELINNKNIKNIKIKSDNKLVDYIVENNCIEFIMPADITFLDFN